MHHEVLGDIEFDDGFAELDPVGSEDQQVDVLIDGCERQPTEKEIDALADACQTRSQRVKEIRSRIQQDYRELLFDALQVWTEGNASMLAEFNANAKSVDDITPEQASSKLELAEIRLETGDPTQIAFDFQFQISSQIDYLVCGRFNLSGQLVEVALES